MKKYKKKQEELSGVDLLVDQFVDRGFATCVQIVAKADFEHRIPYAIAFILSLSSEQLC